jgi:hypothetical protein
VFGRSSDATYRRSQAAPRVDLAISEKAASLAENLTNAPGDHKIRQSLSQQLIDELNAIAGLPGCKIVVADRAQVHDHDGRRLQSKTYGYYTCKFDGGEVAGARIRIYHRTAVRKQIIAPKVFLNTLLHEWTHHYDFAFLRLSRSPHTTGFYKRLRSLAEALSVSFVLPPDPDAPQPATEMVGSIPGTHPYIP